MFYSILYVLPKNLISWTFGKLALLSWPRPLIQNVILWFAKTYKINLEEAEKPIQDYKNLNDFFTRKLKKGIRPIGLGIVHPADAMLTQYGSISEGTMIQAKGKTYFLKDFLQDEKLFERFSDGYFFTYYLCPTDYHRVHSPVSGYITQTHYIPGKLWPVNQWSVNTIPELFAVNERIIMTLETQEGFCALAMVGATNVGKMTLAFDSEICTNTFWNRKSLLKKYKSPVPIQKGDEVGTFHMGSTVIMVYEKSFFKENSQFQAGPVRVGGSLVRN